MALEPSSIELPPALPSMPTLFSSVHSHNAFEETVNRIAGAIKLRLLIPGDRLPPERELAQHLNVSRSTLREALAVLIKAGYLEARRGRSGGTFVANWPQPPSDTARLAIIERMRDHLPGLVDFRRVIEPAAAELAARRATPAELDYLEALLHQMTGAEHDYHGYRTTDARFHMGIARAAKSPLLLQAITDMHTALTDLLDLIVYHSPRVLQRSTEYHWHILDAIRSQQPATAHRVMLDHICATESIFYGLVPEAQWPPEVAR